MMAVDHTTAGAASGETADNGGAEGFTISGKRTEEYGIGGLVYSFLRDGKCYFSILQKEIGILPVSFFIGFFTS